MRSFSYLFEILVIAVLLFLVPIYLYSYQQELLLQGYAQYQVTYFTDSVRNTGYISANMFEQFKKKLAVTNHVYDIELSVYSQYRNSGSGESYYIGTYTDSILDKIYQEGEWFKLKQGEFLSVCIKRKDRAFSERMLNAFGLYNHKMAQIPIRYGGMVRDECF